MSSKIPSTKAAQTAATAAALALASKPALNGKSHMARSGNGRRAIIVAALDECPRTVAALARLDVADHAPAVVWMVNVLQSTKVSLRDPAGALAGYDCQTGDGTACMPSTAWLRHRVAERMKAHA